MHARVPVVSACATISDLPNRRLPMKKPSVSLTRRDTYSPNAVIPARYATMTARSSLDSPLIVIFSMKIENRRKSAKYRFQATFQDRESRPRMNRNVHERRQEKRRIFINISKSVKTFVFIRAHSWLKFSFLNAI